jgi:hypothetical protein
MSGRDLRRSRKTSRIDVRVTPACRKTLEELVDLLGMRASDVVETALGLLYERASSEGAERDKEWRRGDTAFTP